MQFRSWFFCNGAGGEIIVSGEGKSLVGGSGEYPPLENVQIWGSETLFLALVIRYVSVSELVLKIHR